MFLTIRTDTADSEVGLFDNQIIDSYKWHSGTKLSEDLLKKIEELLEKNNLKFNDLKGIVVYRGPGSFTGLRIGITVANTLAYGLGIPVLGSNGKDWQRTGAVRLNNGEQQSSVIPEYGAEAHITKPKK